MYIWNIQVLFQGLIQKYKMRNFGLKEIHKLLYHQHHKNKKHNLLLNILHFM